jgi:predicted ATPase
MITHVSIRNYKSLANVEVDLGPLTVLVGQNATGKSNFVDAFRFISDLLTIGLKEALKKRGHPGVSGSVKSYRSIGENSEIVISLNFDFDGTEGEFTIAFPYHNSRENVVSAERCVLEGKGYEVTNGLLVDLPLRKTTEMVGVGSVILPSSAERFSVTPILDFLLNMGRYIILPNQMRTHGWRTPSPKLDESGSNIGTALWTMKENSPEDFENVRTYLSLLVPDVQGIEVYDRVDVTVVLVKHAFSNETGVTDDSINESDGTLRFLGILTALYQYPRLKLLTIEEPELMIHPGAFGVLSDAIKEASLQSQVIITTHSPDLISEFDPDQIRVVERVNGATRISPLDEGQIETVRKKLFSTGELMLMEGLRGQPKS